MEGASFGAGRAGAALDPVSFARRPQTLLRVASWVFSIAVFGPIVNEGYVNTDSGPELRCVFNGNAGACRFGIALGLGAFLACAAFLLLDVRFQQISSVRDRRRAVLLDLGFSGLWSFLWFVGFCFLTNQWQRTAPGPSTLQAGDAARAAIAFSFFSILSWVLSVAAQSEPWHLLPPLHAPLHAPQEQEPGGRALQPRNQGRSRTGPKSHKAAGCTQRGPTGGHPLTWRRRIMPRTTVPSTGLPHHG
uniref:Synaptogyrin 3 n=1 Tax=Canis lupus familiaris TaxID=9615 RepID=A0A8P0PIA1_CANLF